MIKESRNRHQQIVRYERGSPCTEVCSLEICVADHLDHLDDSLNRAVDKTFIYLFEALGKNTEGGVFCLMPRKGIVGHHAARVISQSMGIPAMGVPASP
jgi:hypothetical protein